MRITAITRIVFYRLSARIDKLVLLYLSCVVWLIQSPVVTLYELEHLPVGIMGRLEGR